HHGNRRLHVATGDGVMLAQPRQQGPAGRIGQGRGGAIQRRWLILNHVVKDRVRGGGWQGQTPRRHSGATDLGFTRDRHSKCPSRLKPTLVRSEGARNPVTNAGDYWIPGSSLRGAPQ